MTAPPDATSPDTLLEWGVAGQALTGQDESGDRHVVAPFAGGTLVGAVDGLGHGREAACATEAAVRILSSWPEMSVLELLRECHEALRETRGAVMSLASFKARERTMTWIGVGNVEGILLRADTRAEPPQETLLLRGGVVGYHLPQLAAAVIPVVRGDTLVFATDGVRREFPLGLSQRERPQQLAERLLARYAKGSDDALVLVAKLIGESP